MADMIEAADPNSETEPYVVVSIPGGFVVRRSGSDTHHSVLPVYEDARALADTLNGVKPERSQAQQGDYGYYDPDPDRAVYWRCEGS